MLTQKRLLVYLIIGVALVGAVVIYWMNRAETNQTNTDHQQEYLYIVTITEGHFNGHELTLVADENVAYFADRPSRLVGQITLQQLVDLWLLGDNNFTASPPNASLAIDGQTAIVELQAPRLMGTTITFQVNVIGGTVPAQFKQASLTIDSAPLASGLTPNCDFSNDDGYTVNYNGQTFIDCKIPEETAFKNLSVTLKGGDGGIRSNWTSQGNGGEGTILEATFGIGDCDAPHLNRWKIKPGSVLRFILGERGKSATANINTSAAGGGGGSAVFSYDGIRWHLLMVAGGGGGAYGSGVGIFNHGNGGVLGMDGGKGRHNPANDPEEGILGGVFGRGGTSLPLNGGGGGGAFGSGVSIDGDPGDRAGEFGWMDLMDHQNYDKDVEDILANGNEQEPSGGLGGDRSQTLRGGWGFGGGGGGRDKISHQAGGGGGGGFSGGGVGAGSYGGGGGGSYISTYALESGGTRGDRTGSPQHGYSHYKARSEPIYIEDEQLKPQVLNTHFNKQADEPVTIELSSVFHNPMTLYEDCYGSLYDLTYTAHDHGNINIDNGSLTVELPYEPYGAIIDIDVTANNTVGETTATITFSDKDWAPKSSGNKRYDHLHTGESDSVSLDSLFQKLHEKAHYDETRHGVTYTVLKSSNSAGAVIDGDELRMTMGYSPSGTLEVKTTVEAENAYGSDTTTVTWEWDCDRHNECYGW